MHYDFNVTFSYFLTVLQFETHIKISRFQKHNRTLTHTETIRVEHLQKEHSILTGQQIVYIMVVYENFFQVQVQLHVNIVSQTIINLITDQPELSDLPANQTVHILKMLSSLK